MEHLAFMNAFIITTILVITDKCLASVLLPSAGYFTRKSFCKGNMLKGVQVVKYNMF